MSARQPQRTRGHHQPTRHRSREVFADSVADGWDERQTEPHPYLAAAVDRRIAPRMTGCIACRSLHMGLGTSPAFASSPLSPHRTINDGAGSFHTAATKRPPQPVGQ